MLFVHLDGSASLYARATGARPCASRASALAARWETWTEMGRRSCSPPRRSFSPRRTCCASSRSHGRDPTAHEPLWQGPLPPGRALQVVTADLDGDKRREVLVGLWQPDGTGELFLLRQGAP